MSVIAFASPPVPDSPVVSANGTDKTGNTNGTHESNGSSGSANTKGSNSAPLTYIDPAADVSLVSNEGRIFKVESYVLKAASSYFRDLLSDPEYKGDPIKIPTSSQTLKAWLDLAHLHNRPPKMVWRIREDLLKLCDTLGSRGVSERALFFMHSAVEKNPWEVFTLASQKNNVGLAKSALKALGEAKEKGHDVHSLYEVTPGLAAGVTLPYLLGVYVAALKVKEKGGSPVGSLNGSVVNGLGDGGLGGFDGEVGWKAIAEKFSPIVG